MDAPRIGPYELLAPLGQGGTAVVYRARDTRNGRVVALKAVRLPRPDLAETIRREFHALARLDHPGIVRVLDHGVSDGQPWMAMAFVRGRPLGSAWTSSLGGVSAGAAATFPLEDLATDEVPLEFSTVEPTHVGPVLDVVARLTRSLAWLHGEGCVHRDLKPANVLVTDPGWPMLVDFGLTLEGAGAGRELLLQPGKPHGTPLYIAPEQIRGEAPDARADLYALGCLLYELLVGRPPFTGDSRRVIMAHLSRPVIPPSERVETVPAALDELVLGLLAKDVEARIGRATEVLQRLQDLGADPTPWPGSPRPKPYLYRPSLVGQAPGRDRMRGAIDAMAHGEPGTHLEIRGPAGSGRTRMAAEAAHFAVNAGLRVVTGRCLEHSGALHALREPLRELATGDTRALLAPYLSGAELADAPPSRVDRVLLVRAAADVLSGSRGEPLAVILDDVHRADRLTADVIAELQRRAPAGLLLITTELDDDPGAGPLDLDPLDPGQIERITADMLGTRVLPPALGSRLVEVSDGNPRFVVEALQLAVQDGWLVPGPDGWTTGTGPDPIPDDLPSLMNRRLNALPGDALTLAFALAIVARPAPLDWLGAIAQLEERWQLEGARTLLRHAVWEEGEGGRLRFASLHMRAAARARIPDALAEQLHRRAAVTVPESLPEADWLRARHLELAGDPEAWRAYADVTPAAYARGANELAVALLEGAIRLAPGAELPRLQMELAKQLSVVGRAQEVPALVHGMLPHLSDPVDLCDARMALLRALRNTGDVAGALEELPRALALRGRVPHSRDFELLQEAVLTHLAAGDLDEAQAWGERALQEAWALDEPDKAVGHVQGNLGVIALNRGERERAGELFLAAVERLRRIGDPRGAGILLGNAGNVASLGGELELARERYTEAIQLLEPTGDALHLAVHEGNLGIVAWEEGDPHTAIEWLTRAVDSLTRQGERSIRSTYRVSLALALLDAGEPERAAGVLALVHGDQDVGVQTVLALGSARVARLRGQDAGPHLAQARRVVGSAPGESVWLACEEALWLRAQGHDAAEAVERAFALAAEHGIDPESRSYLGRFLRELR